MLTSYVMLIITCQAYRNGLWTRHPLRSREQQMAVKDVSVVLAHGAWADGSSWARVITALKAETVNVVATPLPLTSLAEDVAALNRSLDRTEGPIILAGH